MNGVYRNASLPGILLIIGFLLAILIRIVALDADPPSTAGLHFISDEGWWVHNARNKILFDDWILDEFNQSLLISPTFCLATFMVYSFLGVSYATTRIIPILSGILSVLLLTGILRKYLPRRSTVFAAVLFGFSFGFTTLNRTAYVDSTALLFVLLAWWLMEWMADRVWAVFLAGMSIALAVATKSYVLSAMPPITVILALRIWQQRRTIRWRDLALNTLLVAGGIVSVFLLWRKYIYLPNIDEYRIMYFLWQDGNFPSTLRDFLVNLPSFFVNRTGDRLIPPRFFFLNATLVVLAGIRLARSMMDTSGSLLEALRNIPSIEKEAWLFLAIVSMEIAPLTAKPFRRYIFMYLPLIVLAARSIESMATPRSSPYSLPVRIVQWIGLTGPAILILPPFIARLIPDPVSLPLAWLISTGSLIVLTVAAFPVFQKTALHPKKSITCIVVSLFLLLDGGLHLHAFTTRSTTMRDTSRELGLTYFTPGTVVLGGIAHSLCLETTARAITIWGRQEAPRVLNQDPVRRFHPDYLIVLKKLDGQPWVEEERYYRYVDPGNYIRDIRLLPNGNDFRVHAELYQAPRVEPDTPEPEKLLVAVPPAAGH
ncbi:glycosyltransferase family 39 protein [bacterium]|nr:glycosyltransferase family 39 protein [candidate division CSSED10-310 bacterium]